MLWRDADSFGKFLPAEIRAAPDEPDLGASQERRFPNDHLSQQLVQLCDSRNLDFLMSVRTHPDGHVDELDVIQPRLWVHDCLADRALNSTAVCAACL